MRNWMAKWWIDFIYLRQRTPIACKYLHVCNQEQLLVLLCTLGVVEYLFTVPETCLEN